MIEIKVPEVGESITEGLLAEWAVENGARVEKDDPLFELETDKVTLTVTAEAAGRLKILVQAGATVQVGQKVGEILPLKGGEAPAAATSKEAGETTAARPVETTAPAEKRHVGEKAPPAPAPTADGEFPFGPPAGLPRAKAKADVLAHLSPAVRRLVEEHRLDPSRIHGSGRDGRITKEDVLRHLAEPEIPPAPTAPAADPAGSAAGPAAPPSPASASPAPSEAAEHRERMSPLRIRIAERLVQAKQTTAMLTTFNEIDMSRVIALRRQHQEGFVARWGVKLVFMSFFIKASVEALKAVPRVGAQIQGDEIVYRSAVDLGVAVSTDRGLVVPVIRNADRLSFGELERTLAALADKARTGTLTLSEITGGIFTISNGGVYGNLLSTPILNPPQSAVLGLHAVKKRAVAGPDDTVVLRPMMYVALTYDHRLVDGREAVTFLKRIVECIENPERILLEI